MTYFDSTYIAKFYLDEPDSAAVRARAEMGDEPCCSVLGRVEVASVFQRKWREKARTQSECRTLIEQFEADCRAGLWIWLPMSNAVLSTAAAKYAVLPDTIFLRSADAIHLASAEEEGLKTIFSNDRHLLAAAPFFGLAGEVIA